jgi:hypothetical protein
MTAKTYVETRRSATSRTDPPAGQCPEQTGADQERTRIAGAPIDLLPVMLRLPPAGEIHARRARRRATTAASRSQGHHREQVVSGRRPTRPAGRHPMTPPPDRVSRHERPRPAALRRQLTGRMAAAVLTGTILETFSLMQCATTLRRCAPLARHGDVTLVSSRGFRSSRHLPSVG